jgi:hypothetical protein
MIIYSDNYLTAQVDGYKFRRDKKTGYFLSSKLIGNKRKRLHVYVWEKAYGEVPHGSHIHHKDGNKLNNEIENLELLSMKRHAIVHGKNLTDEDRKRRRDNVIRNATPAAKEWHRSADGAEWHSKHGKENMEKRTLRAYKCTCCGAEFTTRHIYGEGQNSFCSNKCKSSFRRSQKKDYVLKVCESCGTEFYDNKYQKIKYCKDCQHRRGYPR